MALRLGSPLWFQRGRQMTEVQRTSQFNSLLGLELIPLSQGIPEEMENLSPFTSVIHEEYVTEVQ